MTKLISIAVSALRAGLKSMILAAIVHLLFIPLIVWSSGQPIGNEITFIALAAFAIQCVLQTFIIGTVYFLSTAILIVADKSALEKSTEQLTVRYFPIILVFYIAVFAMAFQISEGRNLPFIICASIPHLIGVTTGLYFLMQELKQKFGMLTANMSDQGQTEQN